LLGADRACLKARENSEEVNWVVSRELPEPASRKVLEGIKLILGSNAGFLSLTMGENIDGIYLCTAKPSNLQCFFL